MENSGLDQTVRKNILNILVLFTEIEEAIIYGSRANGNYKPASDIDLTLVGENLNLTILQKIETELDDLLLPYKIDILVYHQISNKELIQHINRAGKPFYRSN